MPDAFDYYLNKSLQSRRPRQRRPIQPMSELIPESPPPPSLLERLGGLRGLGAAGVRGLAGYLSLAGGYLGAGVSGLGETGAEAIEQVGTDEGFHPSPARIATEAGLGFIPFRKIFKAGKVVESLLRGGAYAGVGAGARELAQGQDLDPRAIAISGALGAATGGGLAKLLSPAKVVAPSLQVLRGNEAIQDVIERTRPPVPTRREAIQAVLKGEKPPVRTGAREPYQYQTQVPIAPKEQMAATKELLRDQKNLAAVEKWLSTKRAAAEKLTDAEANAARIIADREAAGLVAKPPTYRTSESARVPGQPTESVSIGYGKPKESTLGELLADTPPSIGNTLRSETLRPAPIPEARPLETPLAPEMPFNPPKLSIISKPIGRVIPPEELGIPIATKRYTTQGPVIAEAAAPKAAGEGAEVPSELAKFFKTRGGTEGRGYRQFKEAQAKGELPTAERAAELGISPAAHEQLVSGEFQRGARLKGVTAEKAAKASAVPEEITPDWVKHELSLIEKIKKLPKGGGEKGGINPQLLARLGLGAAGAVIGGATDPLDNPLASAAAGGAAGFAAPSLTKLPSLLSKAAGSIDPASQATGELLSSSEGIKKYVQQAWQMLPQAFRFNYLMGPNLVSNAVAGPVGSGYVGALEAHLSGDPRGAVLLKLMRPDNWAREFYKSWEEAARLTGAKERAGGELVGEAVGYSRATLAAPGTIMTMGDVTTRRLAQLAGFTEEEARRFTLTGEPEFNLMRRIADFPRGSPLGQILLPFSRTLANITEQGGLRTPGLGFLLQAARKSPDTLKQQLIQQAVGAGAGIGGGITGYYSPDDPYNQRVTRGVVSNLGGPAALLSTAGYMGGRALKQGKSASDIAKATLLSGIRSLPLPTTETPEDWINFITARAGERKIPRSAIPAMAREFMEAETQGHRPPRAARRRR